MSDVQFIWFFVSCAILWVLISTACWYILVCIDNEYKTYIPLTPKRILGLFVSIVLGPIIWFITLVEFIAYSKLESKFLIKNHFYRGH